MSTFAVTTEFIEKIYPHSNADSLELAKLEGMSFQFVVPKGKYFEGQLVLFFPLDSLLPEYILEYIGLTGKLSGPKKNRIKTIKLRGEISQGLLVAPDELGMMTLNTPGLDMTEKLGVTKYEPPENLSKNARTRSLPGEISYYDIEGAQKWSAVVDALMEIPVLITEKLEGSNYAAMYKKDGTFVVCTHRQQVEEIEGYTHTWWEVSRRQKIPELCQKIMDAYEGLAQYVVVRGEVVGPKIQGNYYGLPTYHLFVFDIEVDGKVIDAWQWLAYRNLGWFDSVPVLEISVPLKTYLDGKTLQEKSTAQSTLNPKLLREGIVIRPMTEMNWEKLGRVIIKQRSPEYLLKSDT